MKTYLEIAREIGVSKQAVYKRCKGKLYTALLPYVHTKDGTTYIEEQGIALLKSDFSRDTVSIGAEGSGAEEVHTNPQNGYSGVYSGAHTDTAVMTEFIEHLKEQNANLQAQVEDLRAENSKLTDKIMEQSDSILKLANNAQQLHGIDAMKNAQPLLAEGRKAGFFKRWFTGGKHVGQGND